MLRSFFSRVMLFFGCIVAFSLFSPTQAFAGLIGTHVGEFDVGMQIAVLGMVKSKGVPSNYPVTIVVEAMKPQAEIQTLANATAGLKPTVRIAHIDSSSYQTQLETLADALNGVTWPQGVKPMLVLGNELNNLDAGREWDPAPTSEDQAGLWYSQMFSAFSHKIKGYPLAAAPLDMYNGNTTYYWKNFYTAATTPYANATAFAANMYTNPGTNGEPGGIDEWKVFPGKKTPMFFTEFGETPTASLQKQLDFLNNTTPIVDATTLIPNMCGGDGQWLWYIAPTPGKGKLYNLDGSEINPTTCSAGGYGKYIMKDPATEMKESGKASFNHLVTGYTTTCGPMNSISAFLDGLGQSINIDGQKTTLQQYCNGQIDNLCIFQNVDGQATLTPQDAKASYYDTEVPGDRNTSFASYTGNDPATADSLKVSPLYKLGSIQDQCRYNLTLVKAIHKLCQTPPAENYKTLTGGSVLGASSGGDCPLNISLRTKDGSKKVLDIYDQLQSTDHLDDVCSAAPDFNTMNPATNLTGVVPYILKVPALRNIFQVAYIVLVKDYTPPKLPDQSIWFFNLAPIVEEIKKQLPSQNIQVIPVLMPYGLGTEQGNDYTDGTWTITSKSFMTPQEQDAIQQTIIQEKGQLAAAYQKGFPDDAETTDPAICDKYICSPAGKRMLPFALASSGTFNNEYFLSVLGAFINKSIDVGTPTNLRTKYGDFTDEGLGGKYQSCRVTQNDIRGESAKNLGVPLVQPDIYQSIAQLFINVMGTVRQGGSTAPPAYTKVRMFFVLPNQAYLRKTETVYADRYMTPQEREAVNKQLNSASTDKPLLQVSNTKSAVTSDGKSQYYDKWLATPNPTADPQVEITAKLKGSDNSQGPTTDGGLASKAIKSFAQFLSSFQGPGYQPQDTTLEQYWNGGGNL